MRTYLNGKYVNKLKFVAESFMRMYILIFYSISCLT